MAYKQGFVVEAFVYGNSYGYIKGINYNTERITYTDDVNSAKLFHTYESVMKEVNHLQRILKTKPNGGCFTFELHQCF